MSPSAAAITRIEAIDRRLRRKAYRTEVRRILDDAADGQVYSPIDPDERAILAKAYRHDLDRIRTLYPGMLMSFS
jgi:hypothetical protein